MRLAEARLKRAGEIVEASKSISMGRRAKPKHFSIKYNRLVPLHIDRSTNLEVRGHYESQADALDGQSLGTTLFYLMSSGVDSPPPPPAQRSASSTRNPNNSASCHHRGYIHRPFDCRAVCDLTGHLYSMREGLPAQNNGAMKGEPHESSQR